MWDQIIARQTSAPFVTNWNVDDRKSPESLRMRLNALVAQPEVAVVTAGVLLFNDSQLAATRGSDPWRERDNTYTMRLFDLKKSRRVRMRDMFVFHWNGSAPFIHGSQNVPHNSPMCVAHGVLRHSRPWPVSGPQALSTALGQVEEVGAFDAWGLQPEGRARVLRLLLLAPRHAPRVCRVAPKHTTGGF